MPILNNVNAVVLSRMMQIFYNSNKFFYSINNVIVSNKYNRNYPQKQESSKNITYDLIRFTSLTLDSA